MNPVITLFLNYLKTEKRYSPHTLSNYQRDLKRFDHFLRENSIDLTRVENKVIRRFVAHEHHSGLGGRSLRRRLSAIRSLYLYLLNQKQHLHSKAPQLSSAEQKVLDFLKPLTHNPAKDVPAPKTGEHLPKTLDIEQISQLLAITDNDPLALRDIALMEMLYSSGMRLAEIVGLDLAQLDLQAGSARVLGKGDKTRFVPIGKAALNALQNWLQVRPRLAEPGENALFVERKGHRITRDIVQQRLAYWGKRQGLPMRVHPHMLRHSCASHVLESSSDLRGVQELLGHADISTTQVYTHLDFQHLAQVYDKAHPRARKTSR